MSENGHNPMKSVTQKDLHQATATSSQQGISPTHSRSQQVHQEAPKRWFNAQNWIGALAMVLAVVVFARLTTADRAEPDEFPITQLVQLETEDAIPVARQGMPDIELPETGRVLQLGLFSRLGGAELRQQEASLKGYVPLIEKRVADNEVQYVVLLGPYYDQQSMQSTSEALVRLGIKHFERPDAQY
ncbi:MAG: hypothetical protein ACJAYE_001069 [Candidatus Azotimanducaceae bacterium]|jgi:hypothetical protein